MLIEVVGISLCLHDVLLHAPCAIIFWLALGRSEISSENIWCGELKSDTCGSSLDSKFRMYLLKKKRRIIPDERKLRLEVQIKRLLKMKAAVACILSLQTVG